MPFATNKIGLPGPNSRSLKEKGWIKIGDSRTGPFDGQNQAPFWGNGDNAEIFKAGVSSNIVPASINEAIFISVVSGSIEQRSSEELRFDIIASYDFSGENFSETEINQYPGFSCPCSETFNVGMLIPLNKGAGTLQSVLVDVSSAFDSYTGITSASFSGFYK